MLFCFNGKAKLLATYKLLSTNYRITEKFSLERVSAGHLVQPPVESMAKLIDSITLLKILFNPILKV